jgi:hypothetical protein
MTIAAFKGNGEGRSDALHFIDSVNELLIVTQFHFKKNITFNNTLRLCFFITRMVPIYKVPLPLIPRKPELQIEKS